MLQFQKRQQNHHVDSFSSVGSADPLLQSTDEQLESFQDDRISLIDDAEVFSDASLESKSFVLSEDCATVLEESAASADTPSTSSSCSPLLDHSKCELLEDNPCKQDIETGQGSAESERSEVKWSDILRGSSKKKTCAKILLGLAVIITIGASASYFAKPLITSAATSFVDRFGWLGIAIGILCTDATPFIPGEPFVLIGISGGINMWIVFAAASAGSILAAPLGWVISAYTVYYSPRFQKFLDRYKIGPVMRKHGGWCVAASAVLPVWDYSCTIHCAGAVRVNILKATLGACARAPRLLLTCYLLQLGWSM
eukprot:ANDGO_01109.mRNA.1 hypothetical protein